MGPSRATHAEKDHGGPGVPLGALWGPEGTAWEVLNHLGDGLGVTLEYAGSVFNETFP